MLQAFMKIAICDDCLSDAENINSLLCSHNKYKSSDIDIYTESRELLIASKGGKKYDIAFLDVDMPSMNGLELGNELRQANRAMLIVFVSAYSKYAVRAFDCEAFSYLIKPVENNNQTFSVLERLFEKYTKHTCYHTIRINTEYKRILIYDIRYVEYYNKHVIYHMEKGSYETKESLQEVYAILKDYGFYQIHQGYLVNFDKIAEFSKYDVILDDGKILPMSMRRKTDVMLAYSDYAEVHYR